MKKRFAGAFLALAMLLSLLPVSALAASGTLPAAVDGVITLTDDVTLSTSYEVTGDSVIIDLAGHKLSYNSTNAGEAGVFLNVKSGSLTIRDSVGTGVVSVSETYTGQDGQTTIRCVKVHPDATFTLEGGTLTNTNADFYGTQVISNYGTVNIKGGEVKGVTGIFMFAPKWATPPGQTRPPYAMSPAARLRA